MSASHRRSTNLVVAIARELSESEPKAKLELSHRHVDAVSESESQTKLELTNRL